MEYEITHMTGLCGAEISNVWKEISVLNVMFAWVKTQLSKDWKVNSDVVISTQKSTLIRDCKVADIFWRVLKVCELDEIDFGNFCIFEWLNKSLLHNQRKCNLVPSKVWGEITYPFLNFNSCTIEVWESISNFIPHFIMDVNVITYPCLDYS